MKKRHKASIVFCVSLAVTLFLLFVFTGFLQADDINERDVAYWNYTGGEISGTGEFSFDGGNETCWLLIHGYVSTPLEMRGLALAIYGEFNDSVKVMKLVGHGGVPDELYNVSFDDLYTGVEEEFIALEERCEHVNVVGSSMGGTLAIYLAENEQLKNLYLVNAYLSITHKWYYGLYPGFYIEYLGSRLHYSKKTKVARINDPVGRAEHVAYWNMPYYSLKTTEDILPEVRENASLVTEGILAQHSINDPTADFRGVVSFVDVVSSENKKLVLFEDSHHLLLMDYDSGSVVENILEFEREFR